MRPNPLARLLALLAAVVVAVGCAGAPRAASQPTVAGSTAALPTSAAAQGEAAPRQSSTPGALRASPTAVPPGAPVTAEPAASLEGDVVVVQPSAPPTVPSPFAAYPAAQAPTLAPPAPAGTTPVLTARVVGTYPHDPWAYTQGLVYIGDDTFYEGTGLYGASSLRRVGLADGVPRVSLPLPGTYFGEGVAVVGERIFQLTWREGVGFVYTDDGAQFTGVGQFSYPPPGALLPVEGWGLAYDGTRLIMSDGSATLYFVDPEATARSGVLAITGQVEVRDSSGPRTMLNELEYIDGLVYANVYQTELIARIDPATGQVQDYIDLSPLRALLPVEPGLPLPEVLNGIAYDAAGGRLFVTGKHWPRLFEIDLELVRLFMPLALAV